MLNEEKQVQLVSYVNPAPLKEQNLRNESLFLQTRLHVKVTPTLVS